MKAPAALQSELQPGEDLLWHSPAYAPDRLSDYTGPHEFVASLFFGLSALMTLIFFLNMQSAGQMLLSGPLLLFVGGPIIVGLGVRKIGRHRARARAQKTHYGVTSHRILVADDTLRGAYRIDADTIAEIKPSTKDREILRFIESKQVKQKTQPTRRDASRMATTRTVTIQPHEMRLPTGEAEKAQTVINLVKAAL